MSITSSSRCRQVHNMGSSFLPLPFYCTYLLSVASCPCFSCFSLIHLQSISSSLTQLDVWAFRSTLDVHALRSCPLTLSIQKVRLRYPFQTRHGSFQSFRCNVGSKALKFTASSRCRKPVAGIMERNNGIALAGTLPPSSLNISRAVDT